jgi:hypothetical protein
VGSKQYIDAQNEMSLAVQRGIDQIPDAVASADDALRNALTPAIKTTADQMAAGLTTKEALDKRDSTVEANRLARAKGQAATMADAEKAMKELSQAVLGLITPIVDILTPVIGGLAAAISGVANMFSTLPKTVTYGLFGALAGAGAYTAYSKYKKNKDIVAAGGTGKKGLLGAITGAVLTRDGSSPDRALYVIIAGGGGTGSVIDDLVSGDKSKAQGRNTAERNAKAQELRDARKNKKISSKSLKYVKGLAGIGTVLAGISAVGEISEIEKQLSSGEINKNQARTKEAGLAGELAAGAAGGWAGASAGAALGTMLLPGIGTLVGGAIGGLVGGGAGGGLGKYLGEKFGNLLGDSNKANLEEKNKLPEVGQSTDEQIIEHLKKLAEQSEHSNRLHKQAVQHLDDINSNTDNSGPPLF